MTSSRPRTTIWSRRPSAWIMLPDGPTVGDLPKLEGPTREWTPSNRANWC